jgi:hypothetical protein
MAGNQGVAGFGELTNRVDSGIVRLSRCLKRGLERRHLSHGPQANHGSSVAGDQN